MGVAYRSTAISMLNTLLLSDIHANLEALRAVLSDASKRFDEFDSVYVLGDIIGYGATPTEVIEELNRLSNCHIVKGNHEAAALGEIPIHTFNPMAAQAAIWTGNQLTSASSERIRNLPLTKTVRDLTLCHGSPRDPLWEYLLSADHFAENLQHFETPGCAFGHTHLPCFVGINDDTLDHEYASDGVIHSTSGFARWFVNPGSVGQPRDRDSRASYAVMREITPATDTSLAIYEIEFRRVTYDIERAQQRILQSGLPPELAFRLSVGH